MHDATINLMSKGVNLYRNTVASKEAGEITWLMVNNHEKLNCKGDLV